MTLENPDTQSQSKQKIPGWGYIIILFGAFLGALVAVKIVPTYLPSLRASLTGEAPSIFWYLSRASALLAYGMLWLKMLLGILLSGHLTQKTGGAGLANGLHKYTALFGLGLVVFHVLMLLGDHNVSFGLWNVLIPFAAQVYRPLWVGMGQIAIYLWGLLVLSHYMRRKIGMKYWRIFHYFSYLAFGLITIHGIFSGTDTTTPWARVMYIFCVLSLTLLFIIRFFHRNQS